MENIIDVLLSGSAIQLIVFTSTLILSMIYKTILMEWGNSLVSSLKSIIYRQNNKIRLLQYHNMFQVIEEVRNQLKHQKFYCDKELDSTKTAMFVDFMNFKLDAVRDSFLNLIEKAETSKDNDMLKNQVFDAIYGSIEIYTKQTEIHFVRKGVPYDDAVYTVELFERWRLDTVGAIGKQISSIFSSNYHKTKFENLLAILEIISIAIALIPKDGVSAFNSMNGKFMQIKYK